MAAEPLPMFPLGTVLLPGAPLPLQVFEPRYRKMTADCLAGVPEFGVVLIERGNEVGGGDVRTDVGTVARIVAAQSLPDGRAYLVTVGTRRIHVTEWLEDQPYPRALVEDLVDDADAPPPDPEAYAALLSTARRAMALAAELGIESGDATREFGDDPVVGTFEVAAVAPLGALDRQRILSARSAAERCQLLETQLADLTERLHFELGGGESEAGGDHGGTDGGSGSDPSGGEPPRDGPEDR